MRLFAVTMARDVSSAPDGMPGDWTADTFPIEKRSDASPPAVAMSREEIETYQKKPSRALAFRTWRKGLEAPPEPRIHGPVARSPDGQRWEITITNTGTIGKRKV